MVNNFVIEKGFQKAIAFSLVIFFFIISANRLIGFPIDKAAMFLFLGLVLFHYFLMGETISKSSLSILLVIACLTFLTFVINIPESSLIIFFPLMGILFANLVSQKKELLGIIYWALFLHLMFGIFFVIVSYTGTINPYVDPMYDKGIPFLHAAKGFTSTVQAFGTLGITWFLIYYWKKDNDELTKRDKIAYIFAFLAIILTFNRNTLLIFYLILFFKQRGIFLLIFFAVFVLYLYFFEAINSLLFNLDTLTSRSNLLQGFKIAFFERAGWVEYLIGHGNNFVPDEISRTTLYKTGYIENGTSVILYSYGFIGFLLYITASLVLCLKFIIKQELFFALMGGYILLVAQQFTHEYFSTTFYLLISVLLLIMKKDRTGLNKTKDKIRRFD